MTYYILHVPWHPRLFAALAEALAARVVTRDAGEAVVGGGRPQRLFGEAQVLVGLSLMASGDSLQQVRPDVRSLLVDRWLVGVWGGSAKCMVLVGLSLTWHGAWVVAHGLWVPSCRPASGDRLLQVRRRCGVRHRTCRVPC